MQIGTITDHATALAAYQEAGHEFPTIPAGKNTIWHHFIDANGSHCVIINQSGHSPTASDDEHAVNGCTLLVAIDPPDPQTARTNLDAATRTLLGKSLKLDAQLVVKLTRAEKERFLALPHLTGDLGISNLIRRLLAQEEARMINKPGTWTPAQDALLGTDSDARVAALTGKTRDQVIRRRKELGIPSFSGPGRPSKNG